MLRFLSTLSLRRATECTSLLSQQGAISIHALLAESDLYSSSSSTPAVHFYPRSPCGERPVFVTLSRFETLFLSTLSLRRATWFGPVLAKKFFDFYPRSPCGERRAKNQPERQGQRISIHALLAESDNVKMRVICTNINFYPRSPCGERPLSLPFPGSADNFYPRSPCGERRYLAAWQPGYVRYFYPRSPCGERLSAVQWSRASY